MAGSLVWNSGSQLFNAAITPKPLTIPTPDAFALANAELAYTGYNRLLKINGLSPVFDLDGNMTQGALGGALTTFNFDSRNCLSQAGNLQYQYDAENQRIGVGDTQYVINSLPKLSQTLVKTDPDGSQHYYIYGLGLIAEHTPNNQYRSYHYDLRGSTVALSDEAGSVTQRFAYSPYGILLQGDASQTPFLFNGLYGVMTDSNGLYYMRARFYNPEIRRFINQDILLGSVADGQSLNRFAYASGNPIFRIDPEGKAWWFVIPPIIEAIGGAVIGGAVIGGTSAKMTGATDEEALRAATVGGFVGGGTALAGPIGAALAGMIGNIFLQSWDAGEYRIDSPSEVVLNGLGSALGAGYVKIFLGKVTTKIHPADGAWTGLGLGMSSVTGGTLAMSLQIKFQKRFDELDDQAHDFAKSMELSCD